MSVLRAIAFDLVGTLIPKEHWRKLYSAHVYAVKKELSRASGIDINAVAGLLRSERVKVRNAVGYTPSFIETVERLGVSRKTFFAIIQAVDPYGYLVPDKQLSRFLLDFKSRWKLCLLTNTNSMIARSALRAYGVTPDLFDLMICGDNVTRLKPNMEPFRKLLEGLQEPVSAIVVVGDRDIDIIPAKNLGMKTVFVGNTTHNSADIAIKTLKDLPRALDRLM